MNCRIIKKSLTEKHLLLALYLYCHSEYWRLKSILEKRHLANGRMTVNQRGHRTLEMEVESFTLYEKGDKNETGWRQSHVSQ